MGRQYCTATLPVSECWYFFIHLNSHIWISLFTFNTEHSVEILHRIEMNGFYIIAMLIDQAPGEKLQPKLVENVRPMSSDCTCSYSSFKSPNQKTMINHPNFFFPLYSLNLSKTAQMWDIELRMYYYQIKCSCCRITTQNVLHTYTTKQNKLFWNFRLRKVMWNCKLLSYDFVFV